MSLAIRIEGLTKYYGNFLALENVDLSIEEGEFVALLGPNGAGKTTLTKVILGLATYQSGKVSVFGMDIRKHMKRIKSLIGYVHQENNLDPDLDVLENLIVYASFFDIPKDVASRRAYELMEFLEIPKDRRSIDELSGGTKRKLMLARALMNDPKLLILDEPTTGLDPEVRRLFWRKIDELRKRNMTLILTTHYIEEAQRLCDRIIILNQGRIVEDGAPYELVRKYVRKYAIETEDGIIYCDDPEACISQLSKTRYVLRESNLEDVFLKLTGRRIHGSFEGIQ